MGTARYVVIFTSQLDTDDPAYAEASQRLEDKAATLDGFVKAVPFREESGRGVYLSYWESEEAIKAWRADPEHAVARLRGAPQWYSDWHIEVARIERAYSKADQGEKNV